MSPLEILLVLGAVVLVVARWIPPVARPPVTIASALAVVVSGVALGVVGLRWQVALVLVAAALAFPFAVSPVLRARTGKPARRARWWLALPGSVACLGLVAAGPVSAWAFPVPEFPKPSGEFPVGTRVMEWTDPERAEPATAAADDRRTVVAQLWYPAQKAAHGAQSARYLGRTEREARIVSDAFADSVGVPGFLLDGVASARTRSVSGAAVAEGNGRFPIVLFSPGLGGVRTQNTAWAEELASHGYVVVALDHPYDSAAVTLADGRTVHKKIEATGDRATDDRRAAGWAAVRAADLRFVLTQLTRVDRGQGAGPLAGRLDAGRVAVTGHSIGGAAALLAARQDRRFDAVINVDGFPRDPAPRPFHQPVLALTQDVTKDIDPDYLPRLAKTLAFSTATTYRLSVPGAVHLTFTDAPLYLPPVPALVGSLDRTEGPRVTAAASLAFLDSTVRQKRGDLGAALSRYGDLSVRARHPR